MMAGYSSEQVNQLYMDLVIRVDLLNKARRQLDRIRQIAADHESCECSAALMILEVLDRG